MICNNKYRSGREEDGRVEVDISGEKFMRRTTVRTNRVCARDRKKEKLIKMVSFRRKKKKMAAERNVCTAIREETKKFNRHLLVSNSANVVRT